MNVYEVSPETKVGGDRPAWHGYSDSVKVLKAAVSRLAKSKIVMVIECYPATRIEELEENLIRELDPQLMIFSDKYTKSIDQIDEMIRYNLTDDRVFGVMSHHTIEDFYDFNQVTEQKKKIQEATGLTIVYGTGASLLAAHPDLLIYADVNRWEIQKRYRTKKIGNWLSKNFDEDILRKVKRGYFIDWRVADRLKFELINNVDYWLDTNIKNEPNMVSGNDYRAGLQELTKQPFRLVPYFDASVWGGQWMAKHFDLPKPKENYGWAFDGVPEENSIRLAFNGATVETPAMNLVKYQATALLGPKVESRFGAEFPIRFDFLDTMGGGNLSLQVHPLTGYIQDKFGMNYTQDESYYILDATDHSSVYLGTKNGVSKKKLFDELHQAQENNTRFPDESYINQFQVKKHDHVSIPAGTIHCGGADTLVLEISATPYIFTFKLWDWERKGLDGLPRPIYLEHGEPNVVISRNTDWVKENLLLPPQQVSSGDGYVEERTGLNELEFIATHRYWFSKSVRIRTRESVNMLNLVEGDEATITSIDDTFSPYVVHYGETFIIPATISEFVITPGDDGCDEHALLQAYVRS